MTDTRDLVDAITATWTKVRSLHPEVPAVMFTLGEGIAPNGRVTLGHFLAAGWIERGTDQTINEVFIGAEGLAAGADELLDTLLHEAAHALAHARGLADTSRQGRYHNAKFRDVAIELGLECTSDAKRGWAETTLSAPARVAYVNELAVLDTAIGGHRRSRPRRVRASSNNGIALVCGCGRKIRASASTARLGAITCGVCSTTFEEEAS
ncbi:MAG: hypothetical protein QM655_12950 [Nocardioidaceae bacterium]